MKHAKRVGLQRQRRGWRVRNALKKHSTRPRLSVFRSHKNMYAQVIDDTAGRTLVSASTTDKEIHASLSYGGNKSAAAEVGKLLAKRAVEAGITKVTFDRREYKYHGRIAALADAARDAGLDIGAKPEKQEAEPEVKKKGGDKGEKQAKPAKEKKEKKPAEAKS